MPIIIGAIIGTIVFAGGTELFGFVKVPYIGNTIQATVDVQRTVFDTKINDATIKLEQTFFSISPFFIGLPLSEKTLILKMAIDGDVCAENEFIMERVGIIKNRLSCEVEEGQHKVQFFLFDINKGLIDETQIFNFEVR